MKWLILLMLALSASGARAQEASYTAVATTTIVADVASRIGNPTIAVSALVPANADAHAYEPTTDDVARVAQADLLLMVGAGYEAFLGRLLENAGGDIPTVEVSRGVEILAYGDHADEADHDHAEVLGVLGNGLECEVGHTHEHEADDTHEELEHGSCDPHVWMNPRNVIVWANNLADAFAEIDPANADSYRANANAYIAELEALDADIREIVAAVPEGRRILVTNHEFLSYFAHAYGFEVVATVLPGGSTATEIAPQPLAALINLVRAEGVPAIFAEVSANPQLAQVIADEAGVTVVTALYSESLGGAESPAPTYLDMMRYNAQTIADALAG